MRRAIELAQRGWGRVSPNPLVGALIVRDGVVVGEGWHREYGHAHAEVEAIHAAGDLTRGATLYVTLEPCSHRGKTGPCTEAVLASGIARVVYACSDPNPAAEGGGEVLRQRGLEVTAGVGREEARALNGPFFRRFERSSRLPWIELKLALSLDNRLADAEGACTWITGEKARAEVHRLRAGHDAVAVGIGTVLADDPSLTVRGDVVPRNPPVRIVFDRKLRLPLTSRLVRSADRVPVYAIGSPDAAAERRDLLEAAGVRVFTAGALDSALEALASADVGSIFCEGGAGIAGALLGAGLVDRLTLIHAPFFLGPEGLDPFATLTSPSLAEAHRWKRVRTVPFGEDVLASLDRGA